MSHTPSLTTLCAETESKGKGKVTAEEELRASKGKGKMVEPADVDDDEEDEEDFDEDVSAFELNHFRLFWDLQWQDSIFHVYTQRFPQLHYSICMYPQRDGVPYVVTS